MRYRYLDEVEQIILTEFLIFAKPPLLIVQRYEKEMEAFPVSFFLFQYPFFHLRYILCEMKVHEKACKILV